MFLHEMLTIKVNINNESDIDINENDIGHKSNRKGSRSPMDSALEWVYGGEREREPTLRHVRQVYY